MVPKAEESSYSEETSGEESSTESEYGSLSNKEEGMVHIFPNMFDNEETTSSLNMVQVDVEKMLGSDLVETEKEDFVKMCDRYPNLFATYFLEDSKLVVGLPPSALCDALLPLLLSIG